MIQKRQLLLNVVMSVLQVLVNGGILLILYQFLLYTLGVERLGTWAVVLSTSSVATVANSGFSGSVVKYVAMYKARGQVETVSGIVQTATLSVGILLGFLLLAVYPFADWLFSLVIPAANIGEALSILPYVLLSLWITSIASVFQSSFDGYQRFDLKSLMMIISSLSYLMLCLLIVPAFAIKGLAYAQVTQSLIFLTGSWFMLRRSMRFLPVFPFKWNRNLFVELVGYGFSFQISSMSQIFYDPITKILLSRFGGMAMTGYYEMARGMTCQLRALLVTATQVLIPAIADLQETNPMVIQKVYKDAYDLIYYLAVPFFSLIIILAPVISELWIGHYENDFVYFSTLLAIGWFISLSSVPSSSALLGIGDLRWFTIANVSIGVFNMALGLFLGSIFGGFAVVAAWVFSVSAGSLIVPISYHYCYNIPMIELLPKESKGISQASLAGLSICLVFYYQMELAPLAMASVLVLLFFAVMVIPLMKHPVRKRLVKWISHALLRQELH